MCFALGKPGSISKTTWHHQIRPGVIEHRARYSTWACWVCLERNSTTIAITYIWSCHNTRGHSWVLPGGVDSSKTIFQILLLNPCILQSSGLEICVQYSLYGNLQLRNIWWAKTMFFYHLLGNSEKRELSECMLKVGQQDSRVGIREGHHWPCSHHATNQDWPR